MNRSTSVGANCTVRPESVRQGEVTRITCDGAQAAQMSGRTIRLFPQLDGRRLGLMPVPVLEKPGNYSLRLLDQHGTVLRVLTVRVLVAHYPRENVGIESSTAALKPSPGEQEAVTAFRNTTSATRYWEDNIQLPVPGCVTSPFGAQRLFNGKPTGNFHGGLDQRGTVGTPIHAVAAGVVKIVRDFNLRGGTVAIDHGQGFESVYMHMSKTAAKESAHVSTGDVIGYVGATGRSNGPHLHWTLYVNGVPVNPAQWVKLPAPCQATSSATRGHRHPG
ncbi:MAG TPA: M23 family metallopeptidase [Bryobacteraceae bacterium]